ncbi:MAG: alpha-ribazole phosphatase family protein [Gammaproteobacteria bacterium]|nr:alpha-ribazole phosphatase family protein [Gammaproteobacteria bacterium]
MDEQTTIIDILRHGEPVGGARYRGQLDDPLSELGWAQMRAAVAGRDEWQQIVTSDLSRCAAFADELGERLAVPVERCVPFREIGFGDWEGLTAKEIMARDEAALFAFWQDPLTHTPPNGEPLPAFAERIEAAWQALLLRHAGKRLLLVGHAGMMRILLLKALNMPLDSFYRFDLRNAALIRLRVDSGRHGDAYTQLVFEGPTI